MSAPLRTLLFGLGAIGQGIGRLASERPDLDLVGAVDSAPDKAGRPLYDLLGCAPPPDAPHPTVEADAEAALARTRPQVVLHATGSYLPDVLPQLLTCVRAGANVVSTCEELSYPWRRHPDLARELDAAARAHDVTVLGTGVNPGFLLDTLVVVLTTVCQQVRAVRMRRIVDVATRREQLQRKVGVGLGPEEFRRRAASGRFGHVGLQESCWLVAEALGWQLDAIEERLEPVVGPDGKVAGQLQTAHARLGGHTVIEATVQMSVAVEAPRDEIEIDGVPPVHCVIPGGVQGDAATAAVIVNAAPRVVAHAPGLVTMLDLPPLASRGATP